MARATAEGYLNSALRIVEYLPLEMKEVEGRSWDFTQYRGQTITEGASMTVSRVPCYQLVVGGTAVEDIYLQDATSWLARANGLYNRSAGNRFVVIDHVKAGQYVTVTGVQSYGSLNYQTVVNGTQKVMNSTPTTLIFQVNEDGTFAFNPSRYLYIQSIVISDDLSTSRTITYDEVSGYTTFYWNKAIAIPDSVTAYTAQLNEAQDALTLHEITSGYIPACMPVVLYAEGKRGQSDVVTEATDIPSDTLYSDLRGILIAQNTSEYVTDGQVYVLSRQEEASTIGFYKYTGETLAANKAYLVVPASKANAPIVRFDFGQGAADNVTGIEDLNTADAHTTAPARIFDLQGRALRQAPQHGIYLLNGRKVIR
jgi:hypothetical protein